MLTEPDAGCAQAPMLAKTTLNMYLNLLDATQRRQSGGAAAAEAADFSDDATDDVKLFGPRAAAEQPAGARAADRQGKGVGKRLRL